MRKLVLALFLGLTLAACSRSKSGEEAGKPSGDQEPRVIEMGIEAQKHVGLEVAPAAVSQLTELLEVTGTVQPIDSRIGHVRPLANGRLQEVLVRVGDRVVTGQSLARFDNIEAGDLASQLAAAQADLKKLQAQHATALKQEERSRRLVEIGAASQKEFESSQAEAQGLQAAIAGQESVIEGLAARLRRYGIVDADAHSVSITTIRSPFAGVIIKAAVSPGEVVDASSDLFQVADLSRVWVQAEVYEKDLGRIRAGQTALIRVDTYPGEKFAGNMTYIGDVLDPQTRTVKVRCEVPNPGFRLKLDMFASVSLPTTFSHRGLAVPTSAIQQLESKNVVFVRKAETKFEAREVQVGQVIGGKGEILAGLKEGERVVTNGAFHLKSIALGGTFGEEE
jgi:membrane fusion protein, heavy metal efflux system